VLTPLKKLYNKAQLYRFIALSLYRFIALLLYCFIALLVSPPSKHSFIALGTQTALKRIKAAP